MNNAVPSSRAVKSNAHTNHMKHVAGSGSGSVSSFQRHSTAGHYVERAACG